MKKTVEQMVDEIVEILETNPKKKFTIKELSTKVNVAEGTIRSWIMKPIDGQAYSSKNINYLNLVDKLTKYYPEFSEKFGFHARDIEIVSAERSTKRWLKVEELTAGQVITMHNYSLKTDLVYIGLYYDTLTYPNLPLRLFKTAKDEYRVYSDEQLAKENIKMEVKE